MRMRKADSTSIKSYGYDPKSKTLAIRFESNDLYHYADVPKRTFDRLVKAKSKGRFVSRNVRDKFKYIKP